MKITKLYKNSTIVEDLSKDKVEITMSSNEYIELMSILELARIKQFTEKTRERTQKICEKLKDAEKNAKTKWVK